MTIKTTFYRHLHFFLVLVLLLVSINVILIPPQLQAYKSFPQNSTAYPKLPGSASVMWIFYDHLNSTLGIQNSSALATHAINQWNEASTYSLLSIASGGSVNQSQNRIVAESFWGFNFTYTPCGLLSASLPGTKAMGCPGNVSVYLNSSSSFAWNTSVMRASGAEPFTQTLTEDDRRGVAQIYGPYTGFEKSYALSWFPGHTYTNTIGLVNVPAFGLGVPPTPQLIRTSTETVAPYTVTPYRGSQQLKLYGSANNNYSYVYMKLFRASDDELGSNPRHLTITNGMTLQWRQFNHQRSTMSIDILFTDGSTLRDNTVGLTDQFGTGLHPAARGVYGPGSWRYFTVNLSALAGKRVQDIMIAYDNGNNGQTGVFRAYFDNIQIVE